MEAIAEILQAYAWSACHLCSKPLGGIEHSDTHLDNGGVVLCGDCAAKIEEGRRQEGCMTKWDAHTIKLTGVLRSAA